MKRTRYTQTSARAFLLSVTPASMVRSIHKYGLASILFFTLLMPSFSLGVSFPDLTVTNPSVSDTTLLPNQAYTIYATVSNIGSGTASSTTLRYFLSTDATISTTKDTEVATNSILSLAGSSQSDHNSDSPAQIIAPATPGTHWVGACVDTVQDESDTTNQCSAGVEITVGTDCTFVNDERRLPNAECDALVALYNSTGGASWTTNTGWNQDNEPCSWHGVTCTPDPGDGFDRVTSIQLVSNNLSGPLPAASMDNFPSLTYLDLPGNNLTGPIPTELGNLSNLLVLDLDHNEFTGTIPTELGNLTNLKTLELYSVDLLTAGPIPAWIENMTSLQYLSLGHTQRTGSIPSWIWNLTDLIFLQLERNQLTGTLPTALGNLTKMVDLRLDENQLTGTIPTEIESLTQLDLLRLHDNQLEGTIPVGLGSLTKLTEIKLFNNKLTGSIPSGLGNLSLLWVLDLKENQLSGPIPSELGNLAALRYLTLNNNQLTGFIPTGLGNLASIERIHVNDNLLCGEIPTSLTNLTTLDPNGPYPGISIDNNYLHTDDATLDAFLIEKGGEWESTQGETCPSTFSWNLVLPAIIKNK